MLKIAIIGFSWKEVAGRLPFGHSLSVRRSVGAVAPLVAVFDLTHLLNAIYFFRNFFGSIKRVTAVKRMSTTQVFEKSSMN